jgi:hypothetical protein
MRKTIAGYHAESTKDLMTDPSHGQRHFLVPFLEAVDGNLSFGPLAVFYVFYRFTLHIDLTPGNIDI